MTTVRADELLTTAAFRGEVERVREMLDHGGAANAKDERLCTALHWAASMGHIEVAELLIKRGADPNARSVSGETPLHVAAREGDAATAEFLLGSGANPRMCTSAGRTALDLALDFADDEVELLHLLRVAQAQWDARALSHRGGEAGGDAPQPKAARPKVQIVWESDLRAAAAASDTAGGVAAAPPAGTAVDSACGPDEPIDVSGESGAPIGGGPAGAVELPLEEHMAVACAIKPAVPAPAASPALLSEDGLDAGALSSLASKLFAWDAAASKDGMPI